MILLDLNGSRRADGEVLTDVQRRAVMNAVFIFGQHFVRKQGVRYPVAEDQVSDADKRRFFSIGFDGWPEPSILTDIALCERAISRLSFEDKCKVLRGLVFLRVRNHNSGLRANLSLARE